MGKALLIMVMGVGLYIAIGQLGTQETLLATAEDQAGYEEEVLAREVARSGFNMGMGIARSHGSNLQAAIDEIVVDGDPLTGESQGGTYSVRAWLTDGFSITVESTGEFAGAEYVMKDNYKVPVLLVARCSTLDVRFLESMAGYCSAVYLQQHPPGAGPEDIPAPEMIFSAGHNLDNVGVDVDKILAAGTQMDFFIGVDKNCSTRPPIPAAYDVDSHVYNAADYDHVHHALDVPYGFPEMLQESAWAFVEQNRTDAQKWRIGFEDLHYPEWDDEWSDDPQQSLQALKRFGYDGDGWPNTDVFGYRALQDHYRSSNPDDGTYRAYRPDFSDQVIELWMTPINPADSGGICNVGGGEVPPGGGEEPPAEDPPAEDPPAEDPPAEDPPAEDPPAEDPPEPDCACPQSDPSQYIAIMHRRNADSAPQMRCVTPTGAERHLDRHNDYVYCTGDH